MLDPLRGGALFVGLAGAFGGIGADGFRSLGGDVPSIDIQIRELWRVKFQAEVGDWVAAAAAWDDGTIWVATDRGTIWELDAAGSSLRLAHEALDIVRDHGAKAFAKVPRRGMLFLGRHGVMYFRGLNDPGVVVDTNVRSTVRGFAAFDNGDYVVAHGQWRNDPHVEHALHRYDLAGRHVASWHPAFSYPEWGDREWRAVLRMTGGPLAVTEAGDLLLLDAAPFRITRYAAGFGDSATVVIEDESIVSSHEIQRALPRVGTYTFDWNQSIFADEMSDGTILNTVLVSERSLFGTRREALWVVVSASGKVLVQDKNEYFLEAVVGPDTYLATSRSGDLIKLEVSVEDTSQ